MKKVSKEKLS